MTLFCLPGRLSGADAVAKFNRPRFGNFYGLLSRRIRVSAADDPSSRVPPFVERLWMPSYALCFHAERGGKQSLVWTAIDAWSGAFAIIDNIDEIQSVHVVEESFPPMIDEAAAIETARKCLLQASLRLRGQFNKPIVGALEKSLVFYTPHWVLYLRRRNRRIDIRVVDGYSGAIAGAKTRVAILDALIAASKTKSA
ncbi:MAG: hypothetical protein K1Y02_18815 [Candidatus Hydrogenedentes bacterium]|nr:hypothetical protein [Candidatus Hydrogenedentota bacterium]